jgi:xylan 1,4-beta-xylosidase
LQKTEDGWFRLASGGHLPELSIDPPAGEPVVLPAATTHDEFEGAELDHVYQWLRTPFPERFCSLSDRPGHLRLYGMESPGSLFEQALIARRQTDFVYTATTVVDFQPDNFQQMAGLICYYNSSKFHYLHISTDDEIGKHIGIMSCEADSTLTVSFPVQDNRPLLPDDGPTWLRASVDHAALEFSWSHDGKTWHAVPVTLDYSLLSDEAGIVDGEHFTGAFVGMTCNDLTGMRKPADFDSFMYQGRDS